MEGSLKPVPLPMVNTLGPPLLLRRIFDLGGRRRELRGHPEPRQRLAASFCRDHVEAHCMQDSPKPPAGGLLLHLRTTGGTGKGQDCPRVLIGARK
jgi:hypothetical protein